MSKDKYMTESESMNIPWTESPMFLSLIKHSSISEEEKDLARKYYEDGYVVFNSKLLERTLDLARDDAIALSKDSNTITQVGYHYSDSPRLFDCWRKSDAIRAVALNPVVIDTLLMLYRRKPIPFQTINFLKGSNQPLHSDAIHFGTVPNLWVAASWTAFEDMTEDNGTLEFIPGSHKLSIYDYHNLGIKLPKYGTDEQFESYEKYEDFIRQLVRAYPFKPSKKFICKKGDTIIWAANLIHGGAEIKDQNSTRHSQASHYVFEGMEHFFVPRYSTPLEGQYVEKKLTNRNFYSVDGK